MLIRCSENLPVTKAFCSCPLIPVAQGLTTAILFRWQNTMPIADTISKTEPPSTAANIKTLWCFFLPFWDGLLEVPVGEGTEAGETEETGGGGGGLGGAISGMVEGDGDGDGDGEGEGDGGGGSDGVRLRLRGLFSNNFLGALLLNFVVMLQE